MPFPAKPTACAVAVAVFALGGCGVAGKRGHTSSHARAKSTVRAASSKPSRGVRAGAAPRALVTAQTENRLLVVALPGGKVVRQVAVPGEPTYVAASPAVVVVVSSRSGSVTLLDHASLRRLTVLHGFETPHILAISPDGRYAYVTDDATGKLSVIALHDRRIVARVSVGAGAHHLAFSPDERTVWVALAQSAQTLALLSTVRRSGEVDPAHPHVVGYLHPGFRAHDLLFTPGGKQVWVTSADTSYVGVFSARTRRLLFHVPAGAPPQHLVFARGVAYITSGYGSSIERVDLYSGRVLRRVHAPYGSFDLDGGGYVVAASLLQGTLAIYDRTLHLLRVRRLAASTEDVALSRP